MTIREASDTLYKASRDLLVPDKYDEALQMAIRALNAWDGMQDRKAFLLYKTHPTNEDLLEYGMLDKVLNEYFGRRE